MLLRPIFRFNLIHIQKMIDKVKGSLLTGALGDAYGYRFMQADLPASEDQWQFTDTFHYTTATCISIVEEQGVQPDRIAAKMRSWYMEQQLSGLGQETLQTLSEMVGGEHWSIAGTDGDEGGNKGLLRIAPLAFILDPAKPADFELLKQVLGISHQHPEALAGAMALLLSIRYIQNDRLNCIQQVLRQLPPSKVREGLEKISQSPLVRVRDVGRKFGCGKSAFESVPFSIYAAQQASKLGLQSTMNEIVAAGGDVHGNCNLAGYIAGAHLGVQAIPEAWMEKLRNVQGFPESYEAIRDYADFVQQRSGIQTLF